MNRRDFMTMLASGAAVIVIGAGAARAEAVRLGFDPDEVVSYGPPIGMGDGDPVECEAPIWMLLDADARKRLPGIKSQT